MVNASILGSWTNDAVMHVIRNPQKLGWHEDDLSILAAAVKAGFHVSTSDLLWGIPSWDFPDHNARLKFLLEVWDTVNISIDSRWERVAEITRKARYASFRQTLIGTCHSIVAEVVEKLFESISIMGPVDLVRVESADVEMALRNGRKSWWYIDPATTGSPTEMMGSTILAPRAHYLFKGLLEVRRYEDFGGFDLLMDQGRTAALIVVPHKGANADLLDVLHRFNIPNVRIENDDDKKEADYVP